MARSPEQIHDELLVLRCQDGESQALAELAERWHARLGRHARRIAANPEVAADAVQEAWLAIVRNIGKLDDPALFRAWAYRIVGNKCADQVRRVSRKRRLDRQLTDESSPEPGPSTGVAPAHPTVLGAEDELQLLRRVLATLPAERRLLLQLRYLDGASIAEIAIISGIPEGTVKSRLFHARKALKRALEGPLVASEPDR